MCANFNRDALIAHIYDIYCVEQAIAELDTDIQQLTRELESLQSDLYNHLQDLVVRSTHLPRRFDKVDNDKDIKLLDIPRRFIWLGCPALAAAVSIVCVFVLCFGNGISQTEIITFLLLASVIAFLILLLNSINIISDEKRKIIAKNKKEKNANRKIAKIITEQRIREQKNVLVESGRITQAKYEDNIQKQIKLKKEFEKLRFNLYEDLRIIPYPYQNLFSICYIYRYMTSSRDADLHFIFAQLNLEKILNELTRISESQREMVLVQRKLLSEAQRQTALMGEVSSNLQGLRTDFASAMARLHNDLGEISDNQKAIMNNQVAMYHTYLLNAKEQAKTQQEILDYSKMIEYNSDVSMLFQRADFFGLEKKYFLTNGQEILP